MSKGAFYRCLSIKDLFPTATSLITTTVSPLKTISRILLLMLFGARLYAQAPPEPRADSTHTKAKVLALPLVFYTPDTEWGGGASGIFTWGEKRLRSSVSFSTVYTQRKQLILWFPFNFYLGQAPEGDKWAGNDLWQVSGELGWYRYAYQYFGIGNNSPDENAEMYQVTYPRFRITALKYLKHGQYAGLRWAYDDYDITTRDSSGHLIHNEVTGANGGHISGGGLVWVTDTRDNRFYPTKGLYSECILHAEAPFAGSDFRYGRLNMELTKYFSAGRKNVLAFNVVGMVCIGDVPFFQLPQLGGQKRLRGYADGRFRDRRLLLVQGEWRRLLWWRFGSTVFAGAGTVFGTPRERVKIRWDYGIGLRFQVDKEQHINMRIDYGLGKHASGVYVTIGEAF